ncbi:nitroreductase family protein [Cantharellus anzutake]|uniref:nitroreductase family protein n=1 Tax=Cantharellus anzutake TaxID=1750568 RepID=UPI0019035022|nr:nitroreductase family protein [Cantharellus anzutake]KAF8342566.1 nitroreductase family protein [Cantharellus anzutake]
MSSSGTVSNVEGKADPFLEAVQIRRSIYALTNQSTISDERIVKLIEHSILHTPTSFNAQSNVAIVLFGEHHLKLWDIVKDVLVSKLGTEKYSKTEAKINGFRGAYGTVLWFIENRQVEAQKQKFPTYAEEFDSWAIQSIGMAQSNAWVSLEREGLGVNLQHYGNLIGERVRKEFNVPEDWILISQQPFGTPAAGWVAPEKQFKPIEERLRVLK